MKTILLDLGGVVFQSTGKSSERIDWKIISGLNKKYGHGLNLGEDLFPAFVNEYNQETGLNLTGKQFLEEIWKTLTINQELLDFLKPKGRIVILSDNYRENIEYISQLFSFDSWAEKQFYSYDFGMTKSDKTIFLKVIEALGEDAENLVFIDDDPGNVDNAEKCGIRGVVFRGNENIFSLLALD